MRLTMPLPSRLANPRRWTTTPKDRNAGSPAGLGSEAVLGCTILNRMSAPSRRLGDLNDRLDI